MTEIWNEHLILREEIVEIDVLRHRKEIRAVISFWLKQPLEKLIKHGILLSVVR